jgi:hypothetical protein
MTVPVSVLLKDRIYHRVSDYNVWREASDRLRATREEVAVLHGKFEAELARQAAKSAEASKQATTTVNTTSSNLKRSAPSNTQPAPGKTSTTKPIDPPPEPPVSTKKGKKKKRSALANASNPHHLRNYVPSRLPNSGQVNSTQNTNSQNYLSPPPLQFLSARLPPRRKRYGDSDATPSPSTLTNPGDEWICPFCEYKLFYGEDVEYQGAIRNRKKVLKRRRRAQERAAAAASGKSASNATAATDKSDVAYDDGNREAEYEGPYSKDTVQGESKPPRPKAANSTVDEGAGATTASEGT